MAKMDIFGKYCARRYKTSAVAEADTIADVAVAMEL
jgi:hypothetical protein